MMRFIFSVSLLEVMLTSAFLLGADETADIAAFLRLDVNEDGVLSGTEVKSVRAYDTNSDGEVTREEFLAGRRRESKPSIKTSDTVPPPKAIPVDPRVQAWNEQLNSQLDQGTRWAVVVGVNKYAKSPLRFCVPDARLVADTLVKHCGLPRDHVLLMTDDQDNQRLHPRKTHLQEQIPAFLRKAEQRDTVLVFFAGHGMTVEGQSFLCPIDFDSAADRSTGWRVDELRSVLQDCRAGQKLLILDCCHSGGAVTTSGFGATPQELGGTFTTAQGLITFASCRTNQTSLESAELGHGVFTNAMAAGMAGEADFDHNGIIDSDELYRHLLVQVPIAAQEIEAGHKQFPVRIIGQDVVGVFALARPDGKSIDGRKRLKPGDVLTNSIGMSLTVVSRGIGAMGSPRDEALRDPDEFHYPVVMSRPLIVGTYETTQGQFVQVMGTNPSWFSAKGEGAAEVTGLKTNDFPAEQVTWQEAIRFCEKLSSSKAESEAGRQYRLPTEAEREYACRGGTFTPFHTGELISPRQANIRGDRPYINSPRGPALGRTTTVGAYPPNAFGLYDMHGNVAEWCLDRLSSSSLPIGAQLFAASADDVVAMIEEFLADDKGGKAMKYPTNPVGALRGDPRVVRGGSFSSDVSFSRSAARREQDGNRVHRTIGFRVVCEIKK